MVPFKASCVMHQFFQLVVSIVPDQASPCSPLAIFTDISLGDPGESNLTVGFYDHVS